MEVIQGYEILIEEYSKISIYYPGINYTKAVIDYEYYLIQEAINDSNGNKKEAAKKLKLTRRTIYNKINKVKR